MQMLLQISIFQIYSSLLFQFYRRINPVILRAGLLIKIKNTLRTENSAQCMYKNCDYKSANLEEYTEHNRICTVKHEHEFGLQCKVCEFHTKSQSEMEQHILETHLDVIKKVNIDASDSEASAGHESSDSDGLSGDKEVESDEVPDDDVDKSMKRRFKNKYDKLVTHNDTGQTLLRVCNSWREKEDPGFYHLAYKWTVEFRQKNYSIEPLYENFLKPENMRYFVLETCDQYLPLIEKSPKFGIHYRKKYSHILGKCNQQVDWQELNVFQGIALDNKPVIFCGGPIRAVEWVPFPEIYDGDEYIAVSCQLEATHAMYFGDKDERKCLIQVWNLGKIGSSESPRYEYSLAFDYGPVYSMKFCPSGGYIQEIRLGILAIAAMNGNIYLYSLPTRLSDENMWTARVITMTPSLNLTFHFDQSHDESYCKNKATHLVWTKEAGHSVIVAGYGNGMVAIWNVLIESAFLRREPKVLPLHIFYPFSYPINMLDVQAACETRFLVVGAEKWVKMYDLKTYANPTLMTDYKLSNDIFCGVWPLHWSGYVIGRDEGSFLGELIIYNIHLLKI